MVFLLSIQSFKEQCINEGKNKKYLLQMKKIMKEPFIFPEQVNADLVKSLLFPYNTDLSLFKEHFHGKCFSYLGKVNNFTKYKMHQIILSLDNTTDNVNKRINVFNWYLSYTLNLRATAVINWLLQNYTNKIIILLNNSILPREMVKHIISYMGYYPSVLDCLMVNIDVLPMLNYNL
jgi:hypothetical protein